MVKDMPLVLFVHVPSVRVKEEGRRGRRRRNWPYRAVEKGPMAVDVSSIETEMEGHLKMIILSGSSGEEHWYTVDTLYINTNNRFVSNIFLICMIQAQLCLNTNMISTNNTKTAMTFDV